MEHITLSVADGTSMRAYVARPAGKPRAGLLVFQEAFGVNEHIRDVADRFAREGYLAIAPELFHRTAPGLEAGYTDFPAVLPHLQALTNEGLEADIRAAHEWVRKTAPELKVCATGYCMGGRTACLAALTVPLACSVSYYGGGIGPSPMFPSLDGPPERPRRAHAFLLGRSRSVHLAGLGRTLNDKLRELKKPHVSVEFSFADHGFFCDARANYNKEAATEAWSLTQTFLNSHIS